MQEQPPTSDQVQTILEYLGADSAGKVVEGATSNEEAVRKFKLNANSFVKPLVCLCLRGPARASTGDSVFSEGDEIVG